MNSVRRALVLAIAASILTVAKGGAECESFSVSVTPVAFGRYDPTDHQPTTTTGRIDVVCTGESGQDSSLEISLSSGLAATASGRSLVRGIDHLTYNLYRDAGLSLVWGDGSSTGPPLRAHVRPGFAQQFSEYIVYGVIFPGQLVPSGQYQDVIRVTVAF